MKKIFYFVTIQYFFNKEYFEGIFYKLEFDYYHQIQKVCESQNSLMLSDFVEDFLPYFIRLSKTKAFKSQKLEKERYILARVENKNNLKIVGRLYNFTFSPLSQLRMIASAFIMLSIVVFISIRKFSLRIFI